MDKHVYYYDFMGASELSESCKSIIRHFYFRLNICVPSKFIY